jgi:hypothetical protein
MLLASVVVTLITLAPAPSADESTKGISAKAAFDILKSFAGKWQGTLQEKAKGPEATVIYRTTANGSVVLESLFPGTDHEMLTAYHLDGDRLVLTHYCAMSNQPRMAMSQKSTSRELVFDFVGGSNLKPETDTHMHSGVIRITGKDSIECDWEIFQDGKKIANNRFFLTRSN